MASATEKGSKISDIKSYLDWSDKGKSSIGRYLTGTILVFVAFFILAGIGVVPFTLIDPDYKNSIIESNLVLLSAFIVPFILIPLITKFVNKRPYWSVAMPKLAFEKWNFFTGFIVATLAGIFLTFIFNILGILDVEYIGFNWGSLITLGIIGFLGIFIQASSEEMLFRGYLTQFTRKISRNPIIFISIPALLFALPHIGNIAKLGGGALVLIPYFASGVLYGWAAWKSGSLWMGVGLHLSNNWSNVVLVGNRDDVLKPVSPFVAGTPSLTKTTIIIVIQAALTIAILWFLIQRRQKSGS